MSRDRYRASTGYDAQQSPDTKDPMLPSNLYEPVAGDHLAIGLLTKR